jgi:hypothetical protein
MALACVLCDGRLRRVLLGLRPRRCPLAQHRAASPDEPGHFRLAGTDLPRPRGLPVATASELAGRDLDRRIEIYPGPATREASPVTAAAVPIREAVISHMGAGLFPHACPASLDDVVVCEHDNSVSVLRNGQTAGDSSLPAGTLTPCRGTDRPGRSPLTLQPHVPMRGGAVRQPLGRWSGQTGRRTDRPRRSPLACINR